MRACAVLAALATGVAMVAIKPVAAAEPTASFVLGSGSASASVARARLFYGGLSLPLGVGTTSASYTNSQSRALGIALDAGAYVGLAGDVPPQLKPATIDSNSGDKEASGNLDAGEAVARVKLKATVTPAASAEARMTDLDLPALVRVEGAHTLSTVEVRDKKQRRAAATVEVAKVSIANGLVVLNNLRWEAAERSGGDPLADASFSFGGLTISGLPVVIPGADLNQLLGVINTALATTGLRVEAPKVIKTSEGSITMGPLRVALANSELGEQLLGPIISSARPLLAPAFDALTDANKTLGLVGLVADIVLGVADGSGGAEVSVGGATATTSAVGFVAPAAPTNRVDSTPSVGTSIDGPVALPPVPTDVAPIPEKVLDTPQVATTQSVKCALEAAPRRHGDCRNGNLAAALFISGVAVAALAAAEFGVRRRRRNGTEVAA